MYKEVFLALITGGALTALIKGLFDVVRAKIANKHSFKNTIRGLNTIYSELDELKSNTKCDRVLILTAHNGGGKPRVGASIYVSALFETYDAGVRSIKESWQGRAVDSEYAKMLSVVEEDNIVVIHTEDLSPGILKDIYLTDKIKSSVVAKIKMTPDMYYYISCNFKSKIKDETAARVYVLDSISVIKDIL
jgi:hypothetical protein